MSKTLTHTEILQVFSTYLGTDVTIQCQKIDRLPFNFVGAHYDDFFKQTFLTVAGDFSGGTHAVNQKGTVQVSDGCLLRLKHYGQLTDQQCIESIVSCGIVLFGHNDAKRAENARNMINDMYHVAQSIHFETYRHLALLGVDVPHYFGYNHWANGKTATELGLAILVK